VDGVQRVQPRPVRLRLRVLRPFAARPSGGLDLRGPTEQRRDRDFVARSERTAGTGRPAAAATRSIARNAEIRQHEMVADHRVFHGVRV